MINDVQQEEEKADQGINSYVAQENSLATFVYLFIFWSFSFNGSGREGEKLKRP